MSDLPTRLINHGIIPPTIDLLCSRNPVCRSSALGMMDSIGEERTFERFLSANLIPRLLSRYQDDCHTLMEILKKFLSMIQKDSTDNLILIFNYWKSKSVLIFLTSIKELHSYSNQKVRDALITCNFIPLVFENLVNDDASYADISLFIICKMTFRHCNGELENFFNSTIHLQELQYLKTFLAALPLKNPTTLLTISRLLRCVKSEHVINSDIISTLLPNEQNGHYLKCVREIVENGTQRCDLELLDYLVTVGALAYLLRGIDSHRYSFSPNIAEELQNCIHRVMKLNDKFLTYVEEEGLVGLSSDTRAMVSLGRKRNHENDEEESQKKRKCE